MAFGSPDGAAGGFRAGRVGESLVNGVTAKAGR